METSRQGESENRKAPGEIGHVANSTQGWTTLQGGIEKNGNLNFCRIFSLFGVTIHASKDRNGSSWVREPPNLLLSVFGRTGPAEKVPRAGGLQDRTEGSCNPKIQE